VSRFYLTTAIDYVNSKPHLGTAYEKVAADVIARYKKLTGADTWFLMGNDEHSQNVYRAAVEQGLDPVAYCDQMETLFRDTWGRLDVRFDDFIRTTQARHKAGVAALATRIHSKGDIYEGVYEGWYCVGCEAFKQEKDLVDGRCPLHPTTEPQWIREKNYFFRLKKYEKQILDHIQAHPEFIQPEPRRNEIIRLIEGGLEDISVSRAGQSWGVPLPFDPQSVVYVWFDALINYISAVGYGSDQATFERRWPADLHVIGKDITRFHTVIWPAMLMSAGVELPRQVFGHGFMTVNGQRMSKSLGTAIDPVEASGRFGPDPLRLYLIKEIPFGGDGDFTWDRYDERYNADLANNLGNLVSRVTAMTLRYCDGRLTGPSTSSPQIRKAAEEAVAKYRSAMDALEIHEGVAAAFRLIDATNLYIADTAPWTLAKNNPSLVPPILFDCAEAIRLAAVLLSPVMPASSREILRRVGASSDNVDLTRDGVWRGEGERILQQAPALWPRKESQETIRVSDKPEPIPAAASAAAAAPPTAPVAPAEPARISIDDFMKVELRVAKVLAAERVPKSNKLVKLQVDVGTEHRTLVAGIAEAYEPDALVGRTVVIVFNLKPAKLMGIESNGMVLAASAEGGKPMLVGFETPPEPGTRVR
jgi:methionyl-tRNA synthetase